MDGSSHSGHISRGSSDQGVEMGSNKSGAAPTPCKIEKSPEIVVEDSFSSSSFDASIQLLTASSPNQIILRAMEHAEYVKGKGMIGGGGLFKFFNFSLS